MFAVIKTGGKQYIVTQNTKLKIEKLAQNEGEEVVFDKVLLVVGGDKVEIGTPYLEGVEVVGKVEKQGRAKKVIVFKYKRRKRYKRKKGHRQPFSEVSIGEIKTAKTKVAVK